MVNCDQFFSTLFGLIVGARLRLVNLPELELLLDLFSMQDLRV